MEISATSTMELIIYDFKIDVKHMKFHFDR